MKVIILNGPCGVGKSTLAKPLHEMMPLSFLINMDELNKFIANLAEDTNKEERWKVSVAVTKSIVRTMLELGKDVIVDKMIYEPTLLNEVRKMADQFGADVHEILLWADKETVMERAEARGYRKGGRLTPIACELFWHKFDELKAERPDAHLIDTTKMTLEEVEKKVKEIVE